MVYDYTGDLDKAFEYYDLARTGYEELNDKRGLAGALNGLWADRSLLPDRAFARVTLAPSQSFSAPKTFWTAAFAAWLHFRVRVCAPARDPR